MRLKSILSRTLAPLLLVSFGLPVLGLAGVGLYFVSQQGYLVWFLVLMASITLATKVVLVWLHRHDAKLSVQGDSIVEPSDDWSDREYEIWSRGNEVIHECLRESFALIGY